MSIFRFDEAMSRVANGAADPASVLAARRSAVDSAFRDTIRRLGWRLLDGRTGPGELRRSRAFVLGVALWSRPDLGALEDLAGVKWIREKAIPVDVFDLDTCLTTADLAQIAPGVPPITRTPLLAEYEGSRLLEFRVGPAVSAWCREVSAGDPREVRGNSSDRFEAIAHPIR